MHRLLSLLGVLLAACAGGTAPGEQRLPAIISYAGPDSVRVSVPAGARAGAPFTVTIEAYGPSGCVRQGETEVTVSGLVARVRPWRYEPRGEEIACTAIFQIFQHPASITFAEPGTATIRVEGVGPDETPVVAERRLPIAP